MKNSRTRLLTDERGQALVIVLCFLAIGGLTIATLLTFMSTGLKAIQIHSEKAVQQYSADSGIDHACWRLLYEPGFAGSMTPQNPSVSYSININGRDVPVTVTKLAGSSLGPFSFDVNYTVNATHILEAKFVAPQTSGADMVVAYDTQAYSSWLFVPTSSGDFTYYLHNNPTPPIANTNAQANLAMDETVPTATTLYNYDKNKDSTVGRTIQQGSGGATETDLGNMQNWRTPAYTGATHIQGTVVVNLWIAPNGFDYQQTADIRIYLRDYNPSTAKYTEITNATYVVGQNQWTTPWTTSAPEGKYRIVATDGNTKIKAVVRLGLAGYVRIGSFVYQ
jgi:hypothetical protein